MNCNIQKQNEFTIIRLFCVCTQETSAQVPVSPEREAQQTREQKQASVFSVGVGPNVVVSELRDISGIRQSDGSFRQAEDVSWFRSPNFQQIDNLVEGIVSQVCQVVPGPTPPAPRADNLYCRKTCDGFYCFCITSNPPFSVNGTQCIGKIIKSFCIVIY